MDQQGLSSRAIIAMILAELEISLDKTWPYLVGMEFQSDQSSEEYKWLGTSPMLREWIGGRLAKSLRENGITIKNKEFESTIEVFVPDLRRDKTGQIKVRIGEMTDRTNQHWASLLSTLIKNGGASLCYDGQWFFDNDHSEGDSGTLSNLLVYTDYSDLSIVAAANPTAAEMAKIILKLMQHMYSLKDDRGEPLNENARKFLVMVPINMMAAAVQACSMNLLSTGTGAIDNPINNISLEGQRIEVQPVANPRLTSTSELYLFRADGRTKPFIRQIETPIEVSAIAEGSETEFKENKHLYGIKTSRNAGYGLWQQAIKATTHTT